MIEVEMPDGTILQFPEGTDPETMKRAIKSLGAPMDPAQQRSADMKARADAAKSNTLVPSQDSLARAAAADQIAQDQMTLAQGGPVMNAVTKFAQGIPFVGQYSDELTTGIDRATGGTGAAGEVQRQVQDAMDRQYPKTSVGLQVAGGLAGSAGLGGLATKGAQALGVTGQAISSLVPAGLAGRVAAGAAAGAAIGGTEGAVSGYGAGTEGQRGQSAISGGLVGAGLGGVIGGLAPLASAGIKSAVEAWKGRDVSVIANRFGISKDAARVVKAAIENDDMAAADAALRRAGSDAMLADASPATSQLLDTAMQSGGKAARIGREAVDSRAVAANDRITTSLDTILGRPEGVKSASRDVATRTAGLRSQAYDRAYGSPIDYSTGGPGDAILGVIERIPPRTVQAAVSEANDAMRAAGVTNKQILIDIADDGAVSFREMPNVQQLDELKKALGSIAQNETDAITGRITGAGLRAKKLAADLSAAIADAVPQYRTAVKLGGDKIAEQNALDIGRKALLSGTTREQVAEAMAGASRDAQEAARRGLRTYIDDTLANVKAAISDPNTDAREAMRVVKDMSSRANREKVEMVLGKPRADALMRTIDEAAAQLATRSAVARNSATASRLAGKEAIDAITEPGALSTLLAGRPVDAGRKLVQLFTGSTAEAQTAQKQAIYAEIATALTKMRGPDAQLALEAVNKAIAGQPVSSAEAARIARALTTGGALAAYQTGTQSLAK